MDPAQSAVNRQVRYWVMPCATAAVCAAAAVGSFVIGYWAAGALALTLGFVTVVGTRTQVHAYRAGYWRGSYEQISGMVTTREIRNGWQPSPWDDFPPPPPWEDPAIPPQH